MCKVTGSVVAWIWAKQAISGVGKNACWLRWTAGSAFSWISGEAKERLMECKPRPRQINRGVAPKHLPRIDEGNGPDAMTCACRGEGHLIGGDVSERLDIVPA